VTAEGLRDHRGDAEGAELLGFEGLTEQIIGAAIEVHREIGPGLLESSYAACMRHELTCRGLRFEHEKSIPITYKGLLVDCAYRLDLLVEDTVVVELKSVERLERIHDAQLLAYLRLSGRPVGLLINFNVPFLRHGIRRLVCRCPEPESSALSASPR
jgi:GxxExxY protein